MSRSPHPLSAAERMRRYRARRQTAGLRLARSWTPREAIWSEHRVAEARSLAMHVLVARRVAAKPGLLARARATVARWRAQRETSVPAAIEEWHRLLARPWGEVVARSTALTEEGARLRQSSPLATLLEPAERRRIHDAFRA